MFTPHYFYDVHLRKFAAAGSVLQRSISNASPGQRVTIQRAFSADGSEVAGGRITPTTPVTSTGKPVSSRLVRDCEMFS